MTTSLTNKGMQLDFTLPDFVNGIGVVNVDVVEARELIGIWDRYLIAYVVGETPTIESMRRFVASGWNHVANPKVFWHEEGYFIM